MEVTDVRALNVCVPLSTFGKYEPVTMWYGTRYAALMAAVLGTWVGLQYGKTVEHEPWEHGIPELANLLRGAIIGGNLPPLAFGLVRLLLHRS